MTEARSEHQLEGLEPDNLMAFLALLGLLRTLDCARPGWGVRASWRVDKPPVRPVLHIRQPVEQAQIGEAVAEGARSLFGAVDLDERKDLKLSASEARARLGRASAAASSGPAERFAADLLTALGSDAGRPDDDDASTSPLCFPSVARTNFISAIRDIIAAETPTQRDGSTRHLGTAEDAVRRALFSTWERKDRPPGLRWDPEDARLHAYRWTAPTAEQPTTEHGANRLALIGLSCFPVLPSASSRQSQTPVPGRADVNGTFAMSWPIWRDPITLPAIRALMVSVTALEPSKLQAFSVVAVMRSQRVSLDRYISFTRGTFEPAATEVAGPV